LDVDVAALRTQLTHVDVATLSGEDAAKLMSSVAKLGKACDALRGRLATRAADCGVHREEGEADAADWMAGIAGVSPNQARREIDLARSLEQRCSTTGEAFARGQLSFEQAEQIVDTDRVCPGSEADTLAMARQAPLRRLRERCRQLRERTIDPDELHKRRREARCHRQWTDELGMVCYSGRMMPEDGAPFGARVDAETKRVADEAKKRGDEREPWPAYASDALVRLLRGEGRQGGWRAEVIFVVDLSAGRRGYVIDGEVCRILGGPDVPMSVIREQIEQDAFVKLALHDEHRVQLVKHFSRHLSAEVRTALSLGAPPLFDGAQCACGCGARFGLHKDHINPLSNRGPTQLENLQFLRSKEHIEKTKAERSAGMYDRAYATA
jgi:hypothetical protein